MILDPGARRRREDARAIFDVAVAAVRPDVAVRRHLRRDGARLVIDGAIATVIDLRTVKPLDKATVLESVKKTGKALIVYEDNLTGGFGAEVSAIIAEEAFDYLDGPVMRVASPDVPISPFAGPLEEYILPNPEKIAAAIRKLAAY